VPASWLRVSRLPPAELTAAIPELTAVYRRGFTTAAHPPAETEYVALPQVLEKHAVRPDFTLVTARTGRPAVVVGFGYGYRGAPGQYWYDHVAPLLGPEPARVWLSDSFEIPLLVVDAGIQRKGVGQRLVERLLAGRPESTAVLTALAEDARAQRFYRAMEFELLHDDVRFGPTSPRYTMFGRRLGQARPK
jgi:ribosomal protein S18 acetylase RimI-like enzyme